MDLNKTDGSPTDTLAAPEAPKPSFSLNDAQAAGFLEAHPYDVGDTCTATVKLKVTRKSDDDLGPSVGFDILSLDWQGDSADEAESTVPGADKTAGQEGETPAATGDESAEETKVLGYKRPKVKKEEPKLSAKDLT